MENKIKFLYGSLLAEYKYVLKVDYVKKIDETVFEIKFSDQPELEGMTILDFRRKFFPMPWKE